MFPFMRSCIANQQHLVHVQNEVAYEYFGDRFSVTAERKYKQVH